MTIMHEVLASPACQKEFEQLAAELPAGRYLQIGNVEPAPVWLSTRTDCRVDIAKPTDAFPFEGETFDGVILSSVLGHTSDPHTVLKETFRVLKPGGVLVMAEPVQPDDRKYRTWLLALEKGNVPFDTTLTWAFTEGDLKLAAYKAGYACKRFQMLSDSLSVLQAEKPDLLKLKPEFRAIASEWNRLDYPEALSKTHKYANKMHSYPFQYYLDRVQNLGLPADARILDAGCGTGTWSMALAHECGRIDAIDIDEQRVELGRWMASQYNVPNIHYAIGDVQRLAFDDETFDVVFCFGVVISYIPPQVVLQEFFRVLKPGGLLYVCLNGDGWSLFLKELRGLAEPKLQQVGSNSLYNTFCQRHLSAFKQALLNVAGKEETLSLLRACPQASLPPRKKEKQSLYKKLLSIFSPSSPSVSSQLPILPENPDAEGFMQYIQAVPTLAAHTDSLNRAVASIRQYCDSDGLTMLAKDVWNILAGTQTDFSHARLGRGYMPDEIEAVCDQVGFTGFQYAGEGDLSLRPDKENLVFWEPSFGKEFQGLPKVWEFIARRPAQQ